MGITGGDAWMFLDDVMRAVAARDGVNILVKCVLPSLVTSVICCTNGLAVGTSVTEVPQTTQQALARSENALFVICAVVSLLTYLT
jgi:ABC-type transporter Mla maintaining outer membrane lipid asymmetry permease subunit MlaE